MSDNVVSLHGTYTSIEQMMQVMFDKHPTARKGVIALVLENGDVAIAMRCTSAELALTAVRLAHLVNEEQNHAHPHASPSK